MIQWIQIGIVGVNILMKQKQAVNYGDYGAAFKFAFIPFARESKVMYVDSVNLLM